MSGNRQTAVPDDTQTACPIYMKGLISMTLTEIDFAILDFIQKNLSCGVLDFIMPLITHLGSSGALWILIGVVMLIFRRTRRDGVLLAAALMLCLIIGNILLKNIVARDRPCWINGSVNMLISVPKDYSFPSGHSMTAFASAVVLLHWDKRFGIPAMILAFLLAFSRLYLYVHFPSDVLVGALIGCAIGVVVCIVGERIIKSGGAR